MKRTLANGLQYTAIVSLIGLIVLSLLWEGWLAPLRPGGSALIFKAVPLLFPLFGVLHGKRYTYQWSSLMILVYFAEAVVRGWSDHGLSQRLAWLEIVLTTVYFLAAIFYARVSARRG